MWKFFRKVMTTSKWIKRWKKKNILCAVDEKVLTKNFLRVGAWWKQKKVTKKALKWLKIKCSLQAWDEKRVLPCTSNQTRSKFLFFKKLRNGEGQTICCFFWQQKCHHHSLYRSNISDVFGSPSLKTKTLFFFLTLLAQTVKKYLFSTCLKQLSSPSRKVCFLEGRCRLSLRVK